MKAVLKQYLILLTKSTWELLAVCILLFVTVRYGYLISGLILQLLSLPILCMVFLIHRKEEQSGALSHRCILPAEAETWVIGDYILAAAACVLYVLLMQFGGVWPSRFFRMFPCIPFAAAAIFVPWPFITKNRNLQRVLLWISLVIWIGAFHELAKLPIVIVPPSAAVRIAANAFSIVFFVLSMYAAMRCARHTGGE